MIKNKISEEDGGAGGNLPLKKSIEEIYQAGSRARDPILEEKKSFKLAILGVIIFLSVISASVYFVFWKYKKYQTERKSQQQNSISLAASQGESNLVVEKKEEPVEEIKKVEKTEEKTELKKSSEIKVLVLNGGAAKGEAKKVEEILKSQGYSQATAKNASGDYQGETIFYVAGLAEEASEMKEKIKEKYPKIEVKEAVSTEEKSSELVLILGQ